MSAAGEGLLVVRNDRIGDAILALPVIPPLRKAFPESSIYFCASPTAAPLVRCVEGIDGVVEGIDSRCEPENPRLTTLSLRTAFCLRPTFANAWRLFRAGIPVRVGTSRRIYSALFTHRINLPRRRTRLHETELNLKLLAAVGVEGEAFFPRVTIPENLLRTVGLMLPDASRRPDCRLVIVHPGSGGSAREWPVQYFRELADRLTERGNATVIVTGLRGEESKCQTVAKGGHLNLCGKTDLLELAAVISKVGLVVSNSTGPLHIAALLGVRSIGLYPPLADCLPERWGPFGHPEWAMVPDLPLCRRCHPGEISPCACMEALRPEQLFERASQLIDER